MKYSIIIIICLVSACVMSSCGSVKTGSLNLRKQADQAFESGDYLSALTCYQNIDSLSRDAELYRRMTISALNIEDYGRAYQYCQQVNEYDSCIVSGFKTLTENFIKHQREVQIVENDKKFFYNVVGKEYLLKQLSSYYVYCNSEKILDVYSDIEDKNLRKDISPTYLSVAKKVKSDDELKAICLEMLKEDKEQLQALKYLGLNKYNYAEDEYKKAMAEYNKKKNSTTYAYLLRDLKIVSKEYVKSKEYLEKVHKLDPEDQTAIKCLVNIYNRLDQPAKAKSLQKLLK